LVTASELTGVQIKVWDLNGRNESIQTYNAGGYVRALVTLP